MRHSREDERLAALTYIWLFNAGCDPAALDASGLTLAQSLHDLLVQCTRFAEEEATERFMATHSSGEYVRTRDPDITGTYDAGELERLLREAETRR